MSDGRAKVAAALQQASSEKPSIVAMQDVARGEAARIEIVQAGLIDSGALQEPDPEQIQKLVAWDAIERLVGLFVKHEARARTFFRDLEHQGRRG